MYLLAKFQLRTPKAFEVKALQSSSNRKKNLNSRYRKNKLQVLTKTNVTYKWSAAQTRNLHHYVCHKLRSGLLGRLFLLLPNITSAIAASQKLKSYLLEQQKK